MQPSRSTRAPAAALATLLAFNAVVDCPAAPITLGANVQRQLSLDVPRAQSDLPTNSIADSQNERTERMLAILKQNVEAIHELMQQDTSWNRLVGEDEGERPDQWPLLLGSVEIPVGSQNATTVNSTAGCEGALGGNCTSLRTPAEPAHHVLFLALGASLLLLLGGTVLGLLMMRKEVTEQVDKPPDETHEVWLRNAP